MSSPTVIRGAHLVLPDGESLTVRVVVSPYATVVASVYEVLRGLPRGVPASWIAYVQERTAGVDISALDVFDRHFPDFLWPSPRHGRASIERELSDLMAQDPEELARGIRQVHPVDVPPTLRPFLDTPREALRAYVATTRAYWDAVFRPLWPTMEGLLEGEVLRLGASLATDGPSAMLGRVSYKLQYSDGALRFPLVGGPAEPIMLDDRRIVLVPMLSGPDALMASADRSGEVVIAYAAPGASAVWEAVGSEAGGRLREILGDTRAAVLLAVDTPTSTAEVAQRLSLSPALASHHLGRLRKQQLVDSTRFGRYVYYRSSERGRALRGVLES